MSLEDEVVTRLAGLPGVRRGRVADDRWANSHNPVVHVTRWYGMDWTIL
ncbi:hypothetical protein [Amycolatopsis deserti]|nr:hypothetical protein [Amycolatopsis deserti]